MAREISSWLSGPASNSTSGYAGERLGLPEHGPGSIAGFGRRTAALLVDWLIGSGIGGLTVVLGVMTADEYQYVWHGAPALLAWLIIGTVSVPLFGFTPGQYALGIRVVPVDGSEHVGFGRAVIRNLLIVLVIPALFTDVDRRGLHDLVAKTAVVRR